MRPSRLPLLVAAILAVSSPLTAQQDFSKVEIQTIQVAGPVHMLVGGGGNVGVHAGEDGVFLIDDQYAPLTAKILAAVEKIDDGPVRFVLNTHWHGDHTGGNENLGEAGVLIVAHDNVRARMSTDQFIAALGWEVPPSPPAALPVVTFNDTVTFHLNGEEIHAFHVPPAHTDGDAIVHFRTSNAIHMGDLFFNRSFPFIDGSSGGSIDGVIAAAELVLDMVDEETKIIPGHGPLADRDDLVVYRDMLVKVRDAVAALVAEGKTADEVVAAKPSAEYDEVWGGGFLSPERWLRIVHDLVKDD